MKPEDAERDRQALEIFGRAVEMASAETRAAYVEGACCGNKALKARVEALLANHVGDNFLQKPAAAFGPGSTVVTPMTEQPGHRIGRYKLLQKIGEGGMGVVYMAEQEEPVRRQVAFKIIKLGMDTRSVVARFEAERQALAMMDHPNIAKVLDAGSTETGRPYFVMELVRGVPITAYCDKNHLGTTARLDLFIQVCHAVQHAHQKGIIHRDLKPSNVMVTLHDGVPVPKVIDFGIAKATGQRLTEKTLFTNYATMIGTPAYMSPEQAEMSGLDIDTRTDVYALGVLLYELLTGTTPFPAQELLSKGYGEMQRIISEVEPVRPSTRLSTMQNEERSIVAKNQGTEEAALGKGFKGDLDWIVMKCLEKDRTRRYETASGLAGDIKRHLNNEPVVARPPSAAYRFQKLVRRNKLAVAASAAVFMVLIFGVGISTWQALRATRAERKEADLAEQAIRAQGREAEQRSVSEKRLYDLLLSLAKSKRQGHRAGYRNEVFQHLRQAASLDAPQKDPLALRAVAMSCLGDVAGLTPVSITNFPADTEIKWFRIDPSGRVGAFTLSDGSIQLRKLPSGDELERLNLNGEQPAWRCSFSEDGQQLISSHRMDDRSQNSVRVWACGPDGHWGLSERIAAPYANNFGMLKSKPVAYFYDEPAQTYKMVDLTTEKVIVELEHIPPGRILAAGSPPASGFVIVATRDGFSSETFTVHIWDVRAGVKLKELHPKLESFAGLSISKDDRFLACIGRDGVEIYTLNPLERAAELSLPQRMPLRWGAAFARNSALLAIAVDHGGISLWDWANRREVATFDDDEARGVLENGAEFVADDRYLIAVGKRQVRLYPLSAQSERTVVSNGKGMVGMVSIIGFSPDSRRFGFVRGDGQLAVGDVWTGQSLWETNLTDRQTGGGAYVSFVSFHPDGLMAVAGSLGESSNKLKGELSFWSEQRRLHLVNASTNVPPFTWAPEFSPDGRFLMASGGEDRAGNDARGYVWRVNRALSGPTADTLELENVLTTDASKTPMAVHNQHFAYVRQTNGATEIHLVEIEGQRIDRLLARGEQDLAGLQRLRFTPDGRQLLVLNTNHEIVALDILTGEAVTPPIRGRTQDQRGPGFSVSPDGSKLAVFLSMNPGESVEIWDWKAHQYLYSLPEPASRVFSTQWSPDSQHLAVCSPTETSIWHLALVERALAGLGLFAEAAPLSSPEKDRRR